jgi:hypothetical protein
LDSWPPGTPETWRPILLSSASADVAHERLWRAWAGPLPLTTATLKRKLQTVGLLTRAAAEPSLVYVFRSEEEPFLRLGQPAKEPTHKDASRLPPEFLDFYRTLHDGWTDSFGTLGPLPSGRWPFLSFLADEAATAEESEMKARQFLVVAQSGARDYLGFDLGRPSPVAALWTLGSPAQLLPDILRPLDEWMSSDLEDFDDARSP